MEINIKEILNLIHKEPVNKQKLSEIYPESNLEEKLSELEENGDIFLKKDGFYSTLKKENLILGTVRTNEKGFAFLEKINEEGKDIFISQKDLNGALNGDKVIVSKKKKTNKGSEEGKILKILQRNIGLLVGEFFENRDLSFIVLDDTKLHLNITIPKDKQMGAVSGHKVLVEILKYDDSNNQAEGRVIEILGHKNDPGVDILSIIYNHDINIDFSPETMKEVESINEKIEKDELKNRRDLRNEVIFTIDGEDAKDLDDAISIKKLPNGNYKLGVHIADVSHYVKENSSLDKDAFERGTSVYLVDRVIPMLPHKLSNGICSLNPNVDRLTLSCEMIFNLKGDLIDYDIFESIIKTNERMTYTNLRKILLEEDKDIIENYKEFIHYFKTMSGLSKILREKRAKKGSIDFDVKESKIVLDEQGNTKDIVFRDRTVAEKIIEDFMLAANETVAEHFFKEKLPFLYRIHDKPHQQRIHNLINFISIFGYKLSQDKDSVDSKELQKLIEKTKERDEGNIISRLALRTMQQAKYTPEAIGHYGLAMEHYAHFTSPIRRYPDLTIHRLIKSYLHNEKKGYPISENLFEKLLIVGEHTSQRERRAIEAERDTLELKKAEYMSDKIGDEFEGIISSITKFGFFVELDNTIEGLVHIKKLKDDHYTFDEKTFQLIGKKTKRMYTMGDKIKVKLVNVNLNEHSIDFDIVGFKEYQKRKGNNNKKENRNSRKNKFNKLYK